MNPISLPSRHRHLYNGSSTGEKKASTVITKNGWNYCAILGLIQALRTIINLHNTSKSDTRLTTFFTVDIVVLGTLSPG